MDTEKLISLLSLNSYRVYSVVLSLVYWDNLKKTGFRNIELNNSITFAAIKINNVMDEGPYHSRISVLTDL